MSRKSLMIAALLCSGGSLAWAADPAPAVPGFVVPNPVAGVPAANPAPAADATATTPDPTAAAPSTPPAAPDPATLNATLLKMGLEGATRNWKGLAGDVGTLEPLRNSLNPQQQGMLDTAAGLLKGQGVAVPGLPTTDPTATGDGTGTAGTDGTATLVSSPQGGTPQGTPPVQVPPTPATADSSAIPVINQANSDVSAGQSSGQLARDAQSLVGMLGKSLTTSTQQSGQAALMSACSTVIGRVGADIQARNVNAARSDLSPLAHVNGLPASVVTQINALKLQIKALMPSNPQKNQNQQTAQTGQKKHKS